MRVNAERPLGIFISFIKGGFSTVGDHISFLDMSKKHGIPDMLENLGHSL